MIKPYDPLLYRVRRYVSGQSEEAAAAGTEVNAVPDEEDSPPLDPEPQPAPAAVPEAEAPRVPEPAALHSPEPAAEPVQILSDIETPAKPPENPPSDASIVPVEKGALSRFLRR